MLTKLKAVGAWLYSWVTVVVGLVVGGIATLLPMLDVLAGLDLSAFLPAATALKITTGVALAKAVCVGFQKLYAWMTGGEVAA
jgi:hypothetical protein